MKTSTKNFGLAVVP